MTNGRVEVITTVERRRRWSAVEKQRLVAATLARSLPVLTYSSDDAVVPK